MFDPIPSREAGSFLIIYPRRDIVSGYVQHLKESINAELGERELDLALNLRDVGFIDSSGLALLLSYRKQQQQRKRRMALTNASAELQRIFKSTNLNLRFDVFTDEAELEI